MTLAPAHDTAQATGRAGKGKELGTPLYRNGAALALSGLLSAVLGAGFWVVAAHTTPRAAVGEATAMISAMAALSMIAQLNMGPAFAAFLPQAGYRRSSLVMGGTAVAMGLSLLLGAAFVLAAPRLSDSFGSLGDPLTGLFFTLSVAIWSLFALQDAALAGLRRATWVPLKSAGYNLSKFLALVVVGGSVVALLAAWIVPAAIAAALMGIPLVRRLLPTDEEPTPGTDARSFRRFLAGESTAMILDQIGVTLLPVLVVVLLGPSEAAPFGLIWMIVQALDVLVVNMGSSLIVEGAQPGADVRGMHRAMRRRMMLALAVVTGVAALGAPLWLKIFGSEYAEDGSQLFRLLLLGSLGRAIVTLAICAARAERRIAWIVRVHLLLAVLVPGCALTLGHIVGLEGIGLAWALSQWATAFVVLASEARSARGRAGGRHYAGAVPAAARAADTPDGLEPLTGYGAGSGPVDAEQTMLIPRRTVTSVDADPTEVIRWHSGLIDIDATLVIPRLRGYPSRTAAASARARSGRAAQGSPGQGDTWGHPREDRPRPAPPGRPQGRPHQAEQLRPGRGRPEQGWSGQWQPDQDRSRHRSSVASRPRRGGER